VRGHQKDPRWRAGRPLGNVLAGRRIGRESSGNDSCESCGSQRDGLGGGPGLDVKDLIDLQGAPSGHVRMRGEDGPGVLDGIRLDDRVPADLDRLSWRANDPDVCTRGTVRTWGD
jgi:hypothetical protein